jgi:hypothetical protein
MLIKGIPSEQIVEKIASSNKDYEVDFANVDINSDVYTLKVFLRRYDQKKEEKSYKIRLLLTSNILAYPAFEFNWDFEENEYELASRVFHRVCDEVDDIKTHFDRSRMPGSTIAAKIRESVKPISQSHQNKTHIPALDEANKEAGASDWRMSIYSGRYPNMSKEERQEIKKHEYSQIDPPINRKIYPGRGR